MPTYEYKCEACGHTFEKFQSIMAKPIRKCPKCAKNKVRRLLGTGGAMIFKGSGFYITDYRSEGYKSAAKADSGGGSSTSEAKPAADGKAPATPAPAAPAAADKPSSNTSGSSSSGKSESKSSSSKKK